MSKTQKQSVDTLSEAFEELLAQNRQATEALWKQGAEAIQALSALAEETQKEAGNAAQSVLKYASAKYQATLELGKEFAPAGSANGKGVPEAKDALDRHFELTKELYQDLSTSATAIQSKQVEAAKALVAPSLGALEAVQQQTVGLLKYGEALLDACRGAAQEAAAWPQAAAVR